MSTLPAGAFAFVLAGWFGGALAGAWTANRIAAARAGRLDRRAAGDRRRRLYDDDLPHPTWMWAAGIALPLAGGWLAQRLSKAPM